ncbi:MULTISPECIES: SixA phosphatase family protein [Shewanella]|uniref:SixA phosphatase family protein n=1 Tax=Shewanella TaxID=22 RepID=UPI001BBE14FA|nr:MULTISPECIES: phosphoglycerate mutase family protein [Shewanella]GIU54138.1 hypothetical protein TUM4249_37790 [Shewanella sp. KT0246]
MDSNYKKQLNRRYITGLLMTFGLITVLSIMMFSSGLIAAENSINQASDKQKKTYILVRHAEKQKGDNPELTQQGQQRAKRLAHILSSVPLSAIYSTDYKRTKLTALPTSELTAIPLTHYDPRQLAAFASKLQSSSQSHILVVGHSNTTPKLVTHLGGNAGEDINEKSEFDRLYILTSIGNEVSTLVLRY